MEDVLHLRDERPPPLRVAGRRALQLRAEDEQIVVLALGEVGVAEDEVFVAPEPTTPGAQPAVGLDEV